MLPTLDEYLREYSDKDRELETENMTETKVDHFSSRIFASFSGLASKFQQVTCESDQ